MSAHLWFGLGCPCSSAVRGLRDGWVIGGTVKQAVWSLPRDMRVGSEVSSAQLTVREGGSRRLTNSYKVKVIVQPQWWEWEILALLN